MRRLVVLPLDTVVSVEGSRVASGAEGVELGFVEDDPELRGDAKLAMPVRVTTASLKGRRGPTVDHPDIRQLQSGQLLDVVASERDAEGNEWVAVKFWIAAR